MVRPKAVATRQSCADIAGSFAWQVTNTWVWCECWGTIRCGHFKSVQNVWYWGESLNNEQARPSIAPHLVMDNSDMQAAIREINAVVGMMLDKFISKASFWQRHEQHALNTRQVNMLNILLTDFMASSRQKSRRPWPNTLSILLCEISRIW